VSYASFAYVESAVADSVSMFRVSPTGLWAPTSPRRAATGDYPENLVVDPSGKFVYIPNARSSSISQFAIDSSTGVLQPLQPATVPAGAFPQDIAIDPSGRFVYTANTNGDNVSMYTVDLTTGALTPTGPASVPVPFNAGNASGPIGIVTDPLGHFVFVSGESGAVDVYSIDAAIGVLSHVGSTFPGGGELPTSN
jgi:6-phosphogluconolactonase